MTPYANFLYFGLLLYPVVPAVVLGLLGRRTWIWILLATAAMLAIQYWGTLSPWPPSLGQEIWVVVGYAVVQWAVAQVFLRFRAATKSRWPFYLALTIGLLPLVAAKALPLVGPGSLWGFVGISYVTFRTLDVIFNIQDRAITSLPTGQWLGYVFFFPTISSGPIDRYRRFAGDWQHRRTRTEFVQDLDGALHRIFTGFLYKFILAALIKQYWLDPAAATGGTRALISYMYAYSFYLFFDFAGYSAFAIGVSYLFGIHTPENFNRPFLASNIQDFWNRWHISLSWWLRDRVYRRFGLAALKGRWFKDEHTASHLGFFMSFGLMGLWHGLQIHYVLYGLYHAGLMVGYDLFSRWNSRHKLWGEGPLWRAAGILVTFHVVCLGFLLFSGHLTGANY